MKSRKRRRIMLLAAIMAVGFSAGACAGSTMFIGVSAPGPWYGPPVPYGGGVVIGRPIW